MKDVNKIIMDEIGLEVTRHGLIRDQDTGSNISINSHPLVAPNMGGRGKLEFDPYNDRKMMVALFNHFLTKVEEDEDKSVVVYYDVNSEKENKGRVECKMSDNTIIASKDYQRDSLKYLDIIMQMNGEKSPDLREFDVPQQKEAVKRRTTTTKGTKK